MNKNTFNHLYKALLAGVILYLGIVSAGFADVYINVVAVNGRDVPKTSLIHFNLPGELTADDIIDTNGLQLDYSVEDANYFVYGDVTLNPKESKTFRIHVKDKWVVTPDEVADIKKQIDEGYESIGVPYNAQNAQVLKTRLYSKIDYIVDLQSNNVDSTDKRINAYRANVKELKRIQNSALDVAYWRSDPGLVQAPKLIHIAIQVNNPTSETKHYKHKNYLPAEVKPEDVVEALDFEVRYDQIKQAAFLFKEEDLAPGQEKKYSIGILDIWSIDQKDIDYLRARAQSASDFLQDSQYAQASKILMGHIKDKLDAIEASQAVPRPVLQHISAYRANKGTYNDAERDLGNLERLLSAFRENLTKSKVENVLAKIETLKSVADVSKVMFNKKFQSSSAWSFIGWILLFVGFLTTVNFVVWILRSKDKKLKDETPPADKTPKP